jgi:hypothetical protein
MLKMAFFDLEVEEGGLGQSQDRWQSLCRQKHGLGTMFP